MFFIKRWARGPSLLFRGAISRRSWSAADRDALKVFDTSLDGIGGAVDRAEMIEISEGFNAAG